MVPTSPTSASTFGVAVRVCEFTEASKCELDIFDSLYCCYTIDAYNVYATVEEQQKRDENDRSNLTQDEILNAITTIKDLTIGMFVIDSLSAFVALCAVIGFAITKKTEKLPYVRIITICATVIDIGCTFASLGIIIFNDLINEISNLYDHNCYSDETVEDILSLKEQLSQVLILDGLEAALDFFRFNNFMCWYYCSY